MTDDLLLDPSYVVPTVAPGPDGVAWLRAHVARFGEGTDHQRRRAIVDELFAAVPVDGLGGRGHPVAELAVALGLPPTVVADVGEIARAYQPHRPVPIEADAAVERLVALAGGGRDERTANRIGLLVQAHDAMNGLLAGEAVPARTTRRLAPDGTEVEIALTDAPFGRGRHACPARAHAEALAAASFRARHHAGRPLLMPNAWDFASAALLVDAGFTAIGTTSLGVAAAAGVPDASGATQTDTLRLVRTLVALPAAINVDLEDGYGDPDGLARELGGLGVAGVNIEDGRRTSLADPDEQAEILAAFKAAAPHVFLNARIDTHWLGLDQQTLLDRAQTYIDAGADCIFVPGLDDPDEIAAVTAALPVPVNVLAQPSLSVAQLGALGVARVSTGSLLYRHAVSSAVARARDLRDGAAEPSEVSLVSYPAVQALLVR